MTKVLGLVMMMLAVAGFAVAGPLSVPEIDAPSAVGAISLLCGGLAVLRGRHPKK